MLLQFLAQNLHFAVNLFAAMVFFAVFWLYLDAWINKKEPKEIFKWLGALLVSASFLIHSTLIEQSVLGKSIFGDTTQNIANIARLVGYIGLVLGQLIEPLQKEPEIDGLDEKDFAAEPPEKSASAKKAAPLVLGVTKSFGAVFALPAAALLVSLLYLRRATKGMERHLRPVALAFFLLALSEAAALAELARNTDNPSIYNLVRAFGPVWYAEQILLLVGAFVLGRWVWNYLIRRFMSQLFMVFVGMALVIFMITTLSFSYLLMRHIQNSALDNLQTANNVLGYAINSKKAEAKANAEAVAQSSDIVRAVEAKDHNALASLTKGFLEAKQQSNLVVTASSAQVLLRADNPDKWGDSVSSDPLTRKALLGETSSTVTSTEGVLAPVISIKSAAPIRDGGNIVGTAATSVLADNSFVDGIKNSTGLDSAIYSGSTLSATTLASADGKTRQVGVKLNDKAITDKVLVKGEVFKGGVDLLNRPYLAVYAPLKDVNNNVVGMLFIGQPQSAELATVGHNVELTFLVAGALIILSIIPAYAAARHLVRQI